MKIILLSGGKSQRMGRNKLLLQRPDGQTVVGAIIEHARALGHEMFLSVRDAKQAADADLPLLPDQITGAGPLGALHAALARFAEPVLLLAGDLALLDAGTLRQLIDSHSPAFQATCFANRLDQQPEPLCAVYEPGCLSLLNEFLTKKNHCARGFLRELNANVLPLLNPVALDNVNTEDDWREACAKMQSGIRDCYVTIHYHAMLREARGVAEENYHTYANTAAGLYAELHFQYRLPLQRSDLRLAKNQEFTDWDCKVESGDEFIFLQPFSGG